MSNVDQEGSPEYQAYLEGEAKKISEPHIAKIPAEDRNRITGGAHVSGILDLREGKSDQLMTNDRMRKIAATIGDPMLSRDRATFIQGLREFSEKPTAYASGVLESYSKEGVFPESVRTQIEEVALLEGRNTLRDGVAVVVEKLTTHPEITISEAIEAQAKELGSFKESDAVRRTALRQMMEAVYPDILTSPEAAQWSEIKNLGYEDQKNPDVIARLAVKFQELTGDASFAQYASAETIRQGVTSGAIDELDLVMVPSGISRKLQKRMAEKFGSKQK